MQGKNMNPQKILVNSFPVYLFDIVPPQNSQELYHRFWYEIAIDSVIDIYDNLPTEKELSIMIDYLISNSVEGCSDLTLSLEEQTNILWSKDSNLMNTLKFVMEIVLEKLRYIQEAPDKQKAVDFLQKS
ncbi:MAG: hypothetical protein F6K41_06325 [Symploca sp. SIO3E6]|nr:hypothetical protein [Caldora sp. SIO3E6]